MRTTTLLNIENLVLSYAGVANAHKTFLDFKGNKRPHFLSDKPIDVVQLKNGKFYVLNGYHRVVWLKEHEHKNSIQAIIYPSKKELLNRAKEECQDGTWDGETWKLIESKIIKFKDLIIEHYLALSIKNGKKGDLYLPKSKKLQEKLAPSEETAVLRYIHSSLLDDTNDGFDSQHSKGLNISHHDYSNLINVYSKHPRTDRVKVGTVIYRGLGTNDIKKILPTANLKPSISSSEFDGGTNSFTDASIDNNSMYKPNGNETSWSKDLKVAQNFENGDVEPYSIPFNWKVLLKYTITPKDWAIYISKYDESYGEKEVVLLKPPVNPVTILHIEQVTEERHW